MDANTTQITVTKATGTATLTKAADGKWDITLNGQSGGSMHYTQEQVEAIVARETVAGSKVECK